MRRLLRALALGFVLLVAATTVARPSVSALIQKLEQGTDFRVRMRAALELGKRKDSEARRPLERALGDSNPAVRAAAAAALKVLGDARAIPALKRSLNDSSRAVRAQVKASIDALEAGAPGGSSAAGGAEVLVKLGEISAGDEAGSDKGEKRKLLRQFRRASRHNIGQLPGVRVLPDSADAFRKARGSGPPVVMVTGRLRRATLSREGGQVVYSAKVEYVMHRMPERAIASLVSGSAKGKAAGAVAGDKKRLAALQQEVLAAAVASAMRRAPEAIRAAMR